MMFNVMSVSKYTNKANTEHLKIVWVKAANLAYRNGKSEQDAANAGTAAVQAELTDRDLREERSLSQGKTKPTKTTWL